ncbi:hypothetical protein BD769DRAFT_1395038 [Suillus cothurnatus]|nr:hypothetical protein BD769DRAFT_1395038 [Suillus cothurnatus]
MTLAQSLPTIHSKTTVDLCSHSQTARVLGQQPSLFAALPFSQRKDAGLLKGQLLCCLYKTTTQKFKFSDALSYLPTLVLIIFILMMNLVQRTHTPDFEPSGLATGNAMHQARAKNAHSKCRICYHDGEKALFGRGGGERGGEQKEQGQGQKQKQGQKEAVAARDPAGYIQSIKNLLEKIQAPVSFVPANSEDLGLHALVQKCRIKGKNISYAHLDREAGISSFCNILWSSQGFHTIQWTAQEREMASNVVPITTLSDIQPKINELFGSGVKEDM